MEKKSVVVARKLVRLARELCAFYSAPGIFPNYDKQCCLAMLSAEAEVVGSYTVDEFQRKSQFVKAWEEAQNGDQMFYAKYLGNPFSYELDDSPGRGVVTVDLHLGAYLPAAQKEVGKMQNDPSRIREVLTKNGEDYDSGSYITYSQMIRELNEMFAHSVSDFAKKAGLRVANMKLASDRIPGSSVQND